MTLSIKNRQKTRSIETKFLRKVVLYLLRNSLEKGEFELGIHLVAAEEMARVNEQFLQHTGSTDVISFDYSESKESLYGELFVCVDDAVTQAKQFRTNWQSELVRYIVHGLLHLEGYDDLDPKSRRVMKREENRLLKGLSKALPLSQLQRTNETRNT